MELQLLRLHATSLNCSKRKTGNLKLLSVVLNESHSMQHSNRAPRRQYQPLHSILAGFACLLGPCLWLILPLLADAGSVTRIYGAASTLPSSIEPLCAAPALCPEFWDLRPTEGSAVVYGDMAFSTRASCLKSTDGARTFTACPTNYPVTTVSREMDIPANGDLLSLRLTESGFAGCRLDLSTDAGVSWTTITVVAGANLECAGMSVQFPGEKMRCVGAICLVYVRSTSTARLDIYRSIDNGQTWALVSTGAAVSNCAAATNIILDSSGIAIAACQRTITAQTDSTRVSNDFGATWSYIIPPANIDYCGQASLLPGAGTGYGQVCYTTNPGAAGTQFRIMDSTAVAFTPTIPVNLDAIGFSPFAAPSAISLNTTNTWMFNGYTTPVCCAAGRVMKMTNNGDVFYEIPESLDRSYAPARLYQGRVYQGALMVTAPYFNFRFALLQGS